MAGRLDLEVEQGADFIRSLKWKTLDDPPLPINLTNASARMQIRDRQQGHVYVDATNTNGKIVLGGVSGEITINLPSSDTTTFNKRRLKYDLEIWSSSIPLTRVIQGYVLVSPNITQDTGEPVVE